MNRAQWEAAQLPCALEFGYWFSGLVDGEGCFSIAATPKAGWRCDFIIKLRADDRPMLERIRDELDMGRVTEGEHSSENGKPWARWTVTRKPDLVRLTEIFDEFRLRSKKARDYAIWREAVIHWANSDKPVDWWPIEQAFINLESVREFSAKRHGNSVGIPSEALDHEPGAR